MHLNDITRHEFKRRLRSAYGVQRTERTTAEVAGDLGLAGYPVWATGFRLRQMAQDGLAQKLGRSKWAIQFGEGLVRTLDELLADGARVRVGDAQPTVQEWFRDDDNKLWIRLS